MASKITDYKIVKTTEPKALSKLVLSFVGKGWQLSDEVSVTASFNKIYYA